MSLSLDQFREASKPKRMQCGVQRILESLDGKDRDALVVALSDAKVTAAAIEGVLSDAGHRLAQGTVSRHRRGQCGCVREST